MVFSSTDLSSNPKSRKLFLQKNIESLLGARGESELRHLWNLRRDLSGFSVHRKRKIRNSGREKMAFAISWLSGKIFWEQRKGFKDYKKLNKYREQCLRNAISILHDLGYIGPLKYQSYEVADQKDLMRWFNKREKEDKPLFLMPEIFKEDLRGSKLDEWVERLRLNELPCGYLEQWRSEEYLSELKEINGLIRRIMKQLRRTPKMTQRELSRSLKESLVNLPLQRALELLESVHFIAWDRQEKTVSTDRWDPKDKRKFVWLHDSSWPRFGPRLQKGKVHRFADYNCRAVKEWIRTGAAVNKTGGLHIANEQPGNIDKRVPFL